MCKHKWMSASVLTICLAMLSTGANAEPRIGTAASARPKVEAISEGNTQALSAGSEIYANQTVRTGYQGKAGWAEFDHGVVDTMDRVSARYGCGRTMWEYNANLDRMEYAYFRAQKYPIGTGAVESAHRHVLQTRMKRAGQHWGAKERAKNGPAARRWAGRLPCPAGRGRPSGSGSSGRPGR